MNIALDVTSYFPDILIRKNQKVLPFFNCLVPPLGTLLRMFGYGDSLEFILCRNVNFYWARTGGAVICGSELFPLLQDIRNVDRIQVTPQCLNDRRHAFDRIISDLENGIPEVVMLDQFYIKGYMNYQKEHTWHVSLLTGIESDVVSLDDLRQKRKVDLSAFVDAMETYKFLIYTVQVPEIRTNYNEPMLRKIIKRNIVIALDSQAHTEKTGKYKFSMDGAQELQYGVNGIRSLSHYLSNILDTPDIPDPWSSIAAIGSQIYHVVVQHHWHLAFLDASRTILKLQEAGILASIETLKGLVHDWNVIRNMCHKASAMKSSEMVERVSKRMLNVATLEEEFFNSMLPLS